MFALLLALRVGIGAEVYADHCEMIELNTLRTDTGAKIVQVIFWGWRRPYRREELTVFEYKVSPSKERNIYGYDPSRKKHYWKFNAESRGAVYPCVIWANSLVHTECRQSLDPELADRDKLPAYRRRGLFPSLSVLLRQHIKPR